MNASDLNRISVQSSLLASVSYSSQATLEVEFRNGAIYRYLLVPRPIFEALISAPSKGTYFNRHIRNVFRSERIV